MNYTYSDELYHHGILGQKWGVRRYQNEDGTYTAAGKKKRAKQYEKKLNRLDQKRAKAKSEYDQAKEAYEKYGDKVRKLEEQGKTEKAEKLMRSQYARNVAFGKKGVLRTELKLARAEQSVRDTLKEARKEGYTVNSKNVTRAASTGKDILTSAVMSGLFGLYTATALGYNTPRMQEGKQYSVKNK